MPSPRERSRARPVDLRDEPGVAVGSCRPKVAWDLTIERNKIVHIDMLAAPDSLDDLDLTILDA
jgi:hypothetical protein